MLHHGWLVRVMDSHPDTFSHLWPHVSEVLKQQLTTEGANFAEMQIPDCDLVNASFALPLCEPRHFSELWNRIVMANRPGAGSPDSFLEIATHGRRSRTGRSTFETKY